MWKKNDKAVARNDVTSECTKIRYVLSFCMLTETGYQFVFLFRIQQNYRALCDLKQV